MAYDSTADTLAHIAEVQHNLSDVRGELWHRAEVHDQSKLKEPEKSVFDAVTPKLKAMTYGSDEYTASLAEMGAALDHHYAVNSHHPQHYANGVAGMSLLDLIEMLCDWVAATKRHADGDVGKSIEINQERFGIGDQLTAILRNTAREMHWLLPAK